MNCVFNAIRSYRQFALISLFVLISTSTVAKTKIPVLTDSTYFPYSYVNDDNQLKGIFIDVVNAGTEKLSGYEIEFTGMTWKAALSAMRNGNSPFILGAYYHGYDWDFLYPYSQPLLSENVVVICVPNKVSKGAIWPQDFKGNLVTHVAGYEGWLNNKVRTRENTEVVNLLEVPDVSTAWDMLHLKRADCSLFEKQVYVYASRFLPGEGQKPEIVTQLTRETVHLAISKVWLAKANPQEKQKALAFLKEFDDALYQLRRIGRVEEILKNFAPSK